MFTFQKSEEKIIILNCVTNANSELFFSAGEWNSY